MRDPETIVAEHLAEHFGIEYPVKGEGCDDASYWNGLSASVLDALRVEGCRVFASDAELWAWVRERLLSDEAGRAYFDALAGPARTGPFDHNTMRPLTAAIDHADRKAR